MERARLRPAWSLSWLRGEPALYLNAEGPAGRVAGTVWPGAEPAFAGRLRDVDLSMLPLEDLGSPVMGRLDAELDIRAAAGGPIGEIRFEARDGSISLPQIPFGIPYQNAQGVAERGKSGSIVVHELELEGPMLSIDAQGNVATNRRPGGSSLDLEVKLLAHEPALREMLRPYGVRFDENGSARMHLSGPLSRPRIQY
jgi:type II secretion system protein N